MLIPTMNDRTTIMELRVQDDSHLQTAKTKTHLSRDSHIKCIGTTLLVSKKYFKDIFALLKKGDTFKAVVEKDDNALTCQFRYFLRIDRPIP